jgi:hypothetical protein
MTESADKERNSAIVRKNLSKRTGLPSYTLYIQNDDHAIRWCSQTGEVRTIFIGRDNRQQQRDGLVPIIQL